jgi:hypothetical protein
LPSARTRDSGCGARLLDGSVTGQIHAVGTGTDVAKGLSINPQTTPHICSNRDIETLRCDGHDVIDAIIKPQFTTENIRGCAKCLP